MVDRAFTIEVDDDDDNTQPNVDDDIIFSSSFFCSGHSVSSLCSYFQFRFTDYFMTLLPSQTQTGGGPTLKKHLILHTRHSINITTTTSRAP